MAATPVPMCANCQYVMPSITSATGLRCGHKYFISPAWFRKLQRMQHYPEIKPDNACEAWQLHTPDPAEPGLDP